MTAHVVELRMGADSAVVREIRDALLRAGGSLGLHRGQDMLHRLRDMLMERSRDARIVVHALDAPADRSTGFMEIDLLNGPDPFYRLHSSMRAVAKGVHVDIAARRLRTEVVRDIAALQDAGVDPRRRCRLMLTELDLSLDDRLLALWPLLTGEAPVEDLAEALVGLLRSSVRASVGFRPFGRAL